MKELGFQSPNLFVQKLFVLVVERLKHGRVEHRHGQEFGWVGQLDAQGDVEHNIQHIGRAAKVGVRVAHRTAKKGEGGRGFVYFNFAVNLRNLLSKLGIIEAHQQAVVSAIGDDTFDGYMTDKGWGLSYTLH